MKKSRFHEILNANWPDYQILSRDKSMTPPRLLTYAVSYFWIHDIRGEDIEELRNFARKFHAGEEFFSEDITWHS